MHVYPSKGSLGGWVYGQAADRFFHTLMQAKEETSLGGLKVERYRYSFMSLGGGVWGALGI